MNRVMDVPQFMHQRVGKNVPQSQINFEIPSWENWTRLQTLWMCFVGFWVVTFSLLVRLAVIISRDKPETSRPKQLKGHLLVVLGSGGHTAEMLNILRSIPDLTDKYTKRTYVVSSGDGFSALKAADFEKEIDGAQCEIVTVRRARRVHQGVITAPFTTLQCLSDCLKVLRGRSADQDLKTYTYPDLILTNGPGTGVCVVAASIILLFFGIGGQDRKKGELIYEEANQMRAIFVESWARVKGLSLSGKILKWTAGRTLVQWPQLADSTAEYRGPLVS